MTDPADNFASPRVAAGALLRNENGDVLLAHSTYKRTWDLPGGYVERGESPAAACRREVLEVLGVDLTPRRLLAVDWVPSDNDGDKLLFLFACGDILPRVGDITIAESKLDERRRIPIDQIECFTIPCVARRILAVVQGAPLVSHYLEPGARYFDGLGTTT